MPPFIRLPRETEERLNSLAKRTRRTKAYYLRELIEQGLEDAEDYYLAAEVVERIRKGKERVYSFEEVKKDLDRAHKRTDAWTTKRSKRGEPWRGESSTRTQREKSSRSSTGR